MHLFTRPVRCALFYACCLLWSKRLAMHCLRKSYTFCLPHRILQVGGMKFAFDARTRRVLSVRLGNGAWLFGAPAPTKHHTPVVYTGDLLLITNNYVAEGGDG